MITFLPENKILDKRLIFWQKMDPKFFCGTGGFLDVANDFLGVPDQFLDVNDGFHDITDSFLNVPHGFLPLLGYWFLDVSDGFFDVHCS